MGTRRRKRAGQQDLLVEGGDREGDHAGAPPLNIQARRLGAGAAPGPVVAPPRHFLLGGWTLDRAADRSVARPGDREPGRLSADLELGQRLLQFRDAGVRHPRRREIQRLEGFQRDERLQPRVRHVRPLKG
jgi:hypothetical protein